MAKQRVKSADEKEEVPQGKGNSSLTQIPKQSTEAKLHDVKLGTIMGISLPLSLAVFWYVTLPLFGYCSVWLLGAETVQSWSYLKQDIFSYWTSACPLWLTAKERAYIQDHSEQMIRRVTDISQQDFVEFVKKGEPIIITDALRDWEAFGQYSCEYLIDKYPDAEYFDWQRHVFPSSGKPLLIIEKFESAVDEYSALEKTLLDKGVKWPSFQAGKGQKQITLGNLTQREGFSGMQCASGYMEMFWPSNAKYVKEWLSKMKLPYFYPEDVAKESAFSYQGPSGSPPMTGFLGSPGTGVSPHLDETCDNFMTMQLSGVKNWSISWPMRDGDKLHWSKPLLVTLHPGEALLWYVSMQHHTEVIEDCSLSFSFMLKYPPPTDYFNKLVHELSLVDRTERDGLYESVGAAKVDFIDSCSISEFDGQFYIT